MRLNRLDFVSRFCVFAATVLVGACASGAIGSAPMPFPGAGGAHSVNRPPVSESASALSAQIPMLIRTALALQGTRYQLGGDNPATGFDCSGFVRYLFRDQGWELPRTVREQWDYGRKIRERDIQPGDLLFFETESRGPSHVGIAIDPADAPGTASGPAFIHAPGENGTVRIDVLDSRYWQSRFLGARRLF